MLNYGKIVLSYQGTVLNENDLVTSLGRDYSYDVYVGVQPYHKLGDTTKPGMQKPHTPMLPSQLPTKSINSNQLINVTLSLV